MPSSVTALVVPVLDRPGSGLVKAAHESLSRFMTVFGWVA